ncbi:FAD-dependent monooxygenase [Streptomyces buecherae]|uniref:FAD-dependent monooxygenase n=1 Tax=Streptomyces buecherae TaxID=2763006 RepID=UPI003411E777
MPTGPATGPSAQATAETAPTAVLIVGAGPTGLTLACDLARRGVPARVIEQSAALFPGARGKGIQPRTREIFDDLGIGPAIARFGGPYPLMQRWRGSQRLEEWDMLDRSEPHEGSPYRETWMVPQWRTQEVLYERLRELGGSVEFRTRLTGFHQDAHGVSATVVRPSGPDETVRAAYVIAADGGRSTVRRLTGVAMSGHTVDPMPILVADVRLAASHDAASAPGGTVTPASDEAGAAGSADETAGPGGADAAAGSEWLTAAQIDRDHWHVWSEDQDGSTALCPLAGTDTFQFLAQFDDPDAAPDTTPDAVRRLLAERTSLPASAVRDVLWASDFRPRAAMAERFRIGRVFLLGDAAHVHSPAGGQGLNTSVQDAYNLGWKLEQVLRHGAQESLLDTYEEERLPIAAEVLGLSTRLHRGRPLDEAGGGVRMGSDTHQLTLSYAGGWLAVDRRAPRPGPGSDALRPGDRAPNARCVDAAGQEFALFDALQGPHFTLLDFRTAHDLPDAPVPPDPPVTQSASSETAPRTAAAGTTTAPAAGPPTPPEPTPTDHHDQAPLRHIVIRHASAHAQQRYGKAVFLIRPDGYIGLITNDPSDVTGYLTRVRHGRPATTAPGADHGAAPHVARGATPEAGRETTAGADRTAERASHTPASR